MNRCRRYEERKIINIILENHFEKFKQYKLLSIKSKEMRQHIINVIEKALNCGNIEHGYIKHKCLNCDEKQADNMLNVKHRYVVHTFGSDLKWNPHTHALFTEGGIYKNNKWFKTLSHIPYQYLRKSWQKLVLDIIKTNFKDRETQKLINRLYKKYNNGFYVNAQRDLTKIKEAARYIGRYLSRPAIVEYRISGYDGKIVTFWYEK